MKKGKKKRVIIIFDANHACHRSYHAMANLSYNGRGTGVVFGFLQILEGVMNRFQPSKIVSCFDDGRNKNRLKLLPGYKDRDQNKNRISFDGEDFHRQKKNVMRMLKYLGIPSLVAPGHEADDFVYALTKKYVDKGWKVIIVSGDKDFRQLVTKNVYVFDNNKGLITPVNFKKLFVIEPEQYSDYLCLDGDASDKIPGVPGIGPAKAIALLKAHGSVQNFLSNKENQKHNKYEDIKKVFYTNHRLINLKAFDDLYGPFKFVYYKDQIKPTKNIEKYNTLCAKHGIRKFQNARFIDLIP